MHKFFTRSLVASAMTVAFAGALFAAQTTKPATGGATTTTTTTTTTTKHKSATKPASHSAMGTISKFDAASNTLTVTTATGDENFTLGTSAKLNHGSKSLKAEDLGSMTGDKVKVRYTEASGTKTATHVMVSSAAAAKKSTKAPKN